MQIELLEVRDHLHRFAPFDALPEDTLSHIALRIQEAGADRTYLTMSEAGTGLAEHAAQALQTRV